MPSSAIDEYIKFFDEGQTSSLLTTWTLVSPDATLWLPTITTAGIVSFTSNIGNPSALPVFMGLDGLAWTPTISNAGILTLASGTALTASQSIAAIIDQTGDTWILFVGLNGQAGASTNLGIATLFRYPSLLVRWTPTATTDQLTIYSLRLSSTSRLKTS